MEWAEAIVIEGRSISARVVDATGARTVVPTASLSVRGLPTAESYGRPPMRVRLSALEREPSNKYLEAFGMPAVPDACSHAVYKVHGRKGVTWRIPALVLLRAIFWPTRFLMEPLFRPQFLDLCAFGTRGPSSSPQFVGTSATCMSADARKSLPALSWFWQDKLAWEMACSVHDYAMRGRIDIDLPPTEVELGIEGLTVGRSHFATKASIRTVYLQPEDPTAEPVRLHLNAAASTGGSVAGKLAQFRVVRELTGGQLTTEEEWTALVGCLKERRKSKFEGARKQIFDGLLMRIGGEARNWEQLGNDFISPKIYESYYRKWTASGELEAMLAVLRGLRSAARD